MRFAPPQMPMMRYIGTSTIFPEDVEKEEVEREEDAEHAHLEHEEGDHVLLHACAVMGSKLARMEIIVSSVVSSTSTSEMPSTPTLYSMPKKGIHVGFVWTNWKPLGVVVEAEREEEREHERDRRHVRSAK